MALIKCKKCKKEISSTVKFCPHCGESNSKVFCRECGKEMGINDSSCQYCGYIVNQNNFNNNKTVDESKGEKYELALIGLICSFIVPIAGLILGIMALNANKGKQNSARTMGVVATIVSGIEMALVVGILILYFVILFMTFSAL